MKYIHIIEEFSLAGGGVRSVVADVCQEVAKESNGVHIIALSIPSSCSVYEMKLWAQNNNIQFHLVNGAGSHLFTCIPSVRALIKSIRGNDNCCLYMHLKRGVFAGILSTVGLKRVKRVEVFHSRYSNYKLQALMSRPFIDHYLPVSCESKQQLMDNYGIPERKITVAYNGINIKNIISQIKPISRDRNILRFLSVGRLAYQKDLQTSVCAYKEYTSQSNVQSEYLIAGDGPDRAELEKLAEGKVTFMGMIDRTDVYSNIAVTDVIVFPSRWEGHSIALLEVLAIGAPVIATDIPAFREVFGNRPLGEDELFRDEPFGAVFHKENPESCRAAIEYISKHTELLPAMSQYVKSLANNFTTEKQGCVYLNAALN